MKKINLLLFGIIIGIIVTLLIVKYINNNDTKKDSVNESNTIEEKQEEDPLQYVNRINNSEDENTLKDGFVKTIDFLFYGGEINGVKFQDLKEETKLEIMKIAYSIDEKINTKFPDYKENITKETSRIYTEVKEKMSRLYLKTIVSICENNEELCKKAKEGLKKFTGVISFTYDELSGFTKEEFNKLKEWYENYRNN